MDEGFISTLENIMFKCETKYECIIFCYSNSWRFYMLLLVSKNRSTLENIMYKCETSDEICTCVLSNVMPNVEKYI